MLYFRIDSSHVFLLLLLIGGKKWLGNVFAGYWLWSYDTYKAVASFASMKKRQCCAEACFTSACPSIRIILNILKITPKSSQTNNCKTIKRRCQYHTNMLQSGNLQYIHWKRPSIRRLNFPNKSAYIPPKSPILADQLHIDQKRRPRHAQRYTHVVHWCSLKLCIDQ